MVGREHLREELLKLVDQHAVQTIRQLQVLERLVGEQSERFRQTIDTLMGESCCFALKQCASDFALSMSSIGDLSSPMDSTLLTSGGCIKDNLHHDSSTSNISHANTQPIPGGDRVLKDLTFGHELAASHSEVGASMAGANPVSSTGTTVAEIMVPATRKFRILHPFSRITLALKSNSDKKEEVQQAYTKALHKTGQSTRERGEARFYLRERCPWLAHFQVLAESTCFKLVVWILILVNTVHIGVVCHYSVDLAFAEAFQEQGASVEVGRWSTSLDICFVALFSVEVLVRLLASELQFFVGVGWKWNLFDAGLYLASIFEVCLSSANTVSFMFLRNGRVLRILRTVRMIRILRFAGLFRELRVMLLAIMGSAVPLFWACVVLLFILYAFAVMFVQAVTVHLEETSVSDEDLQDLHTYFCSLPMALLTLFMVVSGGVSWWDVIRLFFGLSLFHVMLFLLFVVIMLFAVMNIITGIFVSDAVDRASKDRDIVLEVEQERNASKITALRDLFHEVDRLGAGHITPRDFVTSLETEEVKTVLTTLDLNISDTVAFFKILDVDENSMIEIDEFVMGCMRYMGKAKTVDVETLIQQTRRMIRRSTDQGRRIEQRLACVESTMTLIKDHLKHDVTDRRPMEHRLKTTLIQDREQLEQTLREIHSFIQSHSSERREVAETRPAGGLPWCFSEPVLQC